MNQKEIKRWLYEPEWEEYDHLKTHFPEVVDVDYMQTQIKAFESLARCRMLMSRSHSFIKSLRDQYNFETTSPRHVITPLIDELAKEIDGLPNKEEPC